MSESVALYATFTARPGQADTIAGLLEGYAADVRSEPGNRTFEASRLREEPDRFFVYEVYADEAAFAAHLGAPYGATFNAALGPLITEPASELTFLRLL